MSFLDDLLSDPRALNQIGTTADATGALMGGLSHLQFGIQAQQAATFQADQLRQNAGQVRASAQRQAFDIDRQSQYVASAALASAAASGGGASDPTVVNLIAKNAGEFAYRKAVALYQGDEKAQEMETQAAAKEYEGKSARSNSLLSAGAQMYKAGTTLLKGAARDASLFQRFGGGGPKSGVLTSDTPDPTMG